MIRKVRGLTIVGQQSDLEELLRRIDLRTDDHWRRDREIEARLSKVTGSMVDGSIFLTHCFSIEQAPGRPAASLWLERSGPEQLVVSSILPAERRALTTEEHDAILDDFESSVIRPLVEGLALELRVIPAGLKLERYLSTEAIEALRAFSETASRDELSPSDRRAWKRFLVKAYLGGSLEGGDLDWWLEKEGWPEGTRRMLVDSYETGLSLLAEYDEERVLS